MLSCGASLKVLREEFPNQRRLNVEVVQDLVHEENQAVSWDNLS